jgi:hypothetical protein
MRPEDDYTHPVGPESNFNESMYFHFHDPGNRISGFLRLANRPNEGKGERTICLYLPDGKVAFGFARPDVTTNEKFSAAGLQFDVHEPFTELRAAFDGSVNVLDDPTVLSSPKRLADVPASQCSAELTFARLADPYEHSFDGDGESFAPNHYEQFMRVTGSVSVDGEKYEITGTGIRDHSWGPRSWQAPWFYRWLHGSRPDFGFMGAYFGVQEGTPLTGGFVWDGTTVHQCTEVRVSTDRLEDFSPDRIRVELVSGDKSWRFNGRVDATVPLRHRRKDEFGEEMLTRIFEGQARWTTEDGRELFGMGEYLDQIVDGTPAGLDV